MKPILEISSVTKTFRLRHENKGYLSLRESIMEMFRKDSSSSEEFYALRDVTFNIDKGESIGIIGKNGAGKSTLLKILSRITPPTSGKITVRGRIASLLEVGTGFHPELTGRENIFLNGSVLGMLRKEIKSKFDEIVDFSGTEKFLDTPLKHFSSGMQLRLAFAVAAFLEPEIMVIDEVLAVGDAEFQKKCMGKMTDVSRSGRTIIFVSHNLGAISQLCTKSILLHKGEIKMMGESDKIIESYLQNFSSSGDNVYNATNTQKEISLSSIRTLDDNGKVKSDFRFDESIHVEFAIDIRKFQTEAQLGIAMLDRIKRKVFTIHYPLKNFVKSGDNSAKILLKLPAHIIASGNYSFSSAIFLHYIQMYDYVDDICPVTVMELGDNFIHNDGSEYGVVVVNGQWSRID
jgi:lipopolysaccharide transport system ATP-binding protein